MSSQQIAQIVDQVGPTSARIQPLIRRTWMIQSEWLSGTLNAEVFLKLENQQVTGSFKVRGAASSITQELRRLKPAGVATASTGNHAAAVAYIARRVGIACDIYVPRNTSKAKLRNLERLGCRSIYVASNDALTAEITARSNARRERQYYISPYNDINVIIGQATTAAEIVTQCSKPLDVLLVAVGGGGLIAGVGAVAKSHWPQIEIVGCVPDASPAMAVSVKAGRVTNPPIRPTLSDGTAGGLEESAITFPLCQQLVDHWKTVTESEICDALIQFVECEHQLLEGSAALPVAAALAMKHELTRKRVGIIICGANIGIETLAQLSRHRTGNREL